MVDLAHAVPEIDQCLTSAKYHFLALPRIPFHLSADAGAETSKPESRSESDSSATDSQFSISRSAVPSGALTSLHSLITNLPATTALQVLETLRQTSLEVVDMIKDEMLKTEGFEWGIEVGFHAVPSMR